MKFDHFEIGALLVAVGDLMMRDDVGAEVVMGDSKDALVYLIIHSTNIEEDRARELVSADIGELVKIINI